MKGTSHFKKKLMFKYMGFEELKSSVLFDFPFIIRLKFSFIIVTKYSLWSRFISCPDWSIIFPDDWMKGSIILSGSRFSKSIKPLHIASVMPSASYPFIITFSYASMIISPIFPPAISTSCPHHPILCSHTLSKNVILSSFFSPCCTAAQAQQQHIRNMKKKSQEQIFALEPI